MKDWRLPAIGVLAALCVLAGCDGNGTGGSSTTTTTGGSSTTSGGVTTGTTGSGGNQPLKKTIKIGMIAKSTTNPVFPPSYDGAKASAQELSTKYGISVTVDWLTPAEESGEEQAKRVAQAVNNGDNVILISCSDAAKVTGAINDAVDKGVDVMTFDSDAPDSKRFAFYGVDDKKAGAQVMDELAKQMGEKGNVAILAGNQNAPNLKKRVDGAIEAAKKYPGIKIVDTFHHIETGPDAAAAVKQAMNANPQINGWAMIGGWPLFTTTLLTDLDPAKVKVVAIDALPAELAYVDKGIAPVLLAQPVYDWGYQSVKVIVDKVALGKTVPAMNEMALVKVTKENLGDWARQLQTWGFKDVSPKYLNMNKK